MERGRFAGDIGTYYVVLSDLAVRIIILRDPRHLESNLDEAPREIPNGNKLAKSRL